MTSTNLEKYINFTNGFIFGLALGFCGAIIVIGNI